MKSINRFNKFTPRSYEWSTYVPKDLNIDFSAFDALLQRQQQGFDSAIAASSKLPQYLDTREDYASKYKTGVDQAVSDITSAYANGNVQEGNRKLRDMSLSLNQQWQPGGLAYELNQEYTDYQTAAQNVDKYYKDQKAENSANRDRSLSNLTQAKSNPFNYNDKTGLYTRQAISPSLYPYVDIQEEAQKAVKEIKEQGHTDIVPMGPAWFKKIQTEEVTPETIKAVTEQLLQQPKYRDQMETELWKQKQAYTPEQLDALTQGTQKQVIDQFNGQVKQLDTKLSSGKAADIKQIQQVLANEGLYDGPIDGKNGVDTKAAYDRFKTTKAQEVQSKAQGITPESLLKQNLVNNYVKPLVQTYAYKKEEESLISNAEYLTRLKLQSAKSNTAALIGAVQSLKDVPQSNTLVSPGAARPMEALDDIRKNFNTSYEQSKGTFDRVVQFSGVGTMAGTSNPNDINTITNLRLQSKTPGEFEAKLHAAGLQNANAGQLWNFYSSPAADGLKSSYSTMAQAKSNIDNIDTAKTSAVQNYFGTPEGKKDLGSLRKSFKLDGLDDLQIANMVASKDPRLSNKVDSKYPQTFAGASYNANYVSSGEKVLSNVNSAAKTNPNLFPQSLRGYSLNAIEGAGADLEKVIIDDIKTGNTLGYHSEGQAGVVFKDAGGSKIDSDEVDATKATLRFNVDAKGITYYITAPTQDGKSTVTAAIEAPTAEHGDRLRQMALQMKKESAVSGDRALASQAEQLYVLSTRGERTSRAVEDVINVTDKNGRQLSDIVDPTRSKAGSIATFGNNANMKGLPVGEEIEANGLVYQKYKVRNPKTGDQSYLLTYKTANGQYVPVNNSNGGLYYGTSIEAESPIWDAEMMNQVPVQVTQQKVKANTITERQMNALLLTQPQDNNDE